jgi:hypothetical protein
MMARCATGVQLYIIRALVDLMPEALYTPVYRYG